MFIDPSVIGAEANVCSDEATRLIFPLLEPWLAVASDIRMRRYQPLPRRWDVLSQQKMLRLLLLHAIHPGASFEEMLRQVWQTWLENGCASPPLPSTAALSKARRRVPHWSLREVFQYSAHCAPSTPPFPKWPDHRILTIDGTPLSLPNTAENRQHFGATHHQNGEAYFPQAMAVWIARLHPQIVIAEYLGTCREGDETVAPKLLARSVEPGDLILGDGHYGYLPTLHTLAQRRAFYLVRAPGPLDVPKHIQNRVAEDDWDLRLQRTAYMQAKYPELHLPEALDVRALSYLVPSRDRLNGVERAFFLTNLPRERYSREHLAILPPLRWNHETLNNDVKSRLGLEALRSLSPNGVYAEILAHLIVANFVRLTLWQVAPDALFQGSFTAALSAIRTANEHLRTAPERRARIVESMRQMILAQPLVPRPGRSEPRMTRPRRRPYMIFKEARATWREARKVG